MNRPIRHDLEPLKLSDL